MNNFIILISPLPGADVLCSIPCVFIINLLSKNRKLLSERDALLPMKELNLPVESDSTESRTVKNAQLFLKNQKKNKQNRKEKFKKNRQIVHKELNKYFTSNTDNAIVIARQCSLAGMSAGA